MKEKPICRKCSRAHWFFQGCDKGTNPPVQIGYDTLQGPSEYRARGARKQGYNLIKRQSAYPTQYGSVTRRITYKDEPPEAA
jgi:hypothetical protein